MIASMNCWNMENWLTSYNNKYLVLDMKFDP